MECHLWCFISTSLLLFIIITAIIAVLLKGFFILPVIFILTLITFHLRIASKRALFDISTFKIAEKYLKRTFKMNKHIRNGIEVFKKQISILAKLVPAADCSENCRLFTSTSYLLRQYDSHQMNSIILIRMRMRINSMKNYPTMIGALGSIPKRGWIPGTKP